MGLAICYNHGQGIHQSSAQAHAWCKLAVSEADWLNDWLGGAYQVMPGDWKVSAYFEDERALLAELASKMSAEELAESERLYNQYLAFKGKR